MGKTTILTLGLGLGAVMWTGRASASQLVEVLPLTDRVLMVHFDDGSVTLAQIGQDVHADKVDVVPIDRVKASTASSYKISSSDDSAYSSPVAPSQVGRKSKGTEFANHCDTWNGSMCVDTTPDRAMEHWIYLVLPTAMKSGKTYTIDTGTLAANATTTKLVFDETKVRSEAIHVNTVAYASSAPAKYGYVYHWLGDLGGLDVTSLVGRGCHLVRTSDGTKAFDATLQFRKGKTNVETAYASDTPNQNFLGSDVADCDFSSFATAGEYVLAVDGVGSSFPFKIDPDAFRAPFYAAMKGLYLNRSDALDAQYAEGFSRPKPHDPKVTPNFAGMLKYTSTRYFDVSNSDASSNDKTAWEAGIKGDIDTWGWYMDAGDWDAYFTHASIPALLLTLFEQHPEHFVDGELKIPESGNGIPDVVDEARWLVRFYHRTRHAILDKGYGTGGVGGARVMGDLWGSDLPDGVVAGSWQDTKRMWIVSGEDPWTTYRYAGLAAHLATVLASIGKPDPENIDWKAEAIAAWQWAQANTKSGDDTASAFGFPLRQVRMHAEVALFRLTGDATYHDAFKTDFATATEKYDGNSWYWELVYPRAQNADGAIRGKIVAALAQRAKDDLMGATASRATRWGGNLYMPMFLGQGSTPLISDAVLALEATDTVSDPDRTTMRSLAYTTADYFLGTNPLNTTWVSRLGPRYPKGPFHLDGLTQGGTYPPMGLVPYGPVAVARDFMPSPPQGPWASNWVNSDVYPTNIDTWPGHERWFDQHTGISTCEFTVHQTTVVSAVVFGSLLGVPPPSVGNPDGGTTDGGTNGDAGDEEGTSSGGCGCHTTPSPGAWPIALGIALLLLRYRRRK